MVEITQFRILFLMWTSESVFVSSRLLEYVAARDHKAMKNFSYLECTRVQAMKLEFWKANCPFNKYYTIRV